MMDPADATELDRPAATGGPPVVLVVEDSPQMSGLLSEVLEEEGLVVRVARNGADAVAQARALRPALITLDLGLPGMSGWQVVEALQADPATAAIPVIAVSAHARDLAPAFQARVAHVVAKPFYVSDVVEVVLATLGRAGT